LLIPESMTFTWPPGHLPDLAAVEGTLLTKDLPHTREPPHLPTHSPTFKNQPSTSFLQIVGRFTAQCPLHASLLAFYLPGALQG